MKITELQTCLRHLTELLRAANSSLTAIDLEQVVEGLTPFADLTTKQFIEFLAGADEYRKTGAVASKGPKQPKTKILDEEKLTTALQAIQSLYERATQPEVTYEGIDSEVSKWEKDLSKDEGIELARRFEIVSTFNSKAAAMQEIRRKIAERKAIHERTQF